MCELPLQEVADSLKTPVRMVWEARPVPGVALKLVQKQERIEVPEFLNRNLEFPSIRFKGSTDQQTCLSSNAPSDPGSSPF